MPVCLLNCFSHVWLFATIWTVAHQDLPSTGFSMEEDWVGCHTLLKWIFLTQGLNLCLLRLPHCRWILYSWVTGEDLKLNMLCLKLQDLDFRRGPYDIFFIRITWTWWHCFQDIMLKGTQSLKCCCILCWLTARPYFEYFTWKLCISEVCLIFLKCLMLH